MGDGSRPRPAPGVRAEAVDRARRTEILGAAAEIFATRGIRASLRDIADACGILPGSLYHHFESKEAIAVELAARYLDELEQTSAAALDRPAGEPLDDVVRFGTEVAGCAVRHRAALLLTFYEPPTVFGPELVELAGRTPVAITTTMAALLDRAADAGRLRPVDRHVLADRICQGMLHVGIGVFHRRRGASSVPAIKCRMLLEGLATEVPGDAQLDASAARRAADEAIAGWPSPDVGDDRTAGILAAARSEFARRGYEATTVRDVAAAAGVSARTVYRVAESKEDLIASILGAHVHRLAEGWDAVLGSASSAVEKLDALLWFDVNVLDRFHEENRIQQASLRFAPPSSPDLGLTFPNQLGQVHRLLADADAAGHLRPLPGSADVRARCAFSLLWTPEGTIRALGAPGAMAFARDTLLRGAAAPG